LGLLKIYPILGTLHDIRPTFTILQHFFWFPVWRSRNGSRRLNCEQSHLILVYEENATVLLLIYQLTLLTIAIPFQIICDLIDKW